MCWFLPFSTRRFGFPALIAVVVLLLAMSTGTTLAHSDEGAMEITKFEQSGPGTVELEIGIVYANDDHQAEDASVTATMTGPDGATAGPVDLAPSSEAGSLYSATIPLGPGAPSSGTWTAQVTSTNPDASANGSLEVEDAPAASTTTGAPTTEAPTTTAADDPGGVEGETTAADADEDDEGSIGLLAPAAVVAVVVIGGGAYLASRGRGTAGDAIE